MLKQIYTLSLTVLVALIFAGSIIAQSSSISNVKEVYTGTHTKVQTPAGQNIPIPYDGTLALLFDNGPLVTNPAGGSGGADLSALQTAIGLGTYGFGAQISAGNSVADDFTINGASWNIEELQFFTYQTGSSTTSTINDARIRIWNGAPNAGGTIVFGDLTTNRLSSTSWTNIYRALDTSPSASDRPIMRVVVQFSPALTLGPGTYWVEVSLGGTLASGPWAPPVSIVGQTTTGDALQLTSTGWAAAVDGTYPQGIPFIVLGNSGPPCPVQTPENPTPANNAVDVPITGVNLSWSNGGPGTVPPTQVEVFFGPAGNMVSVYSGAPVTQWSPGTLNYFTNYQWKVVNKIDTCNISSSTWAFRTMQDPNLVEHCEPFADLSNWTIVGPLGLTNWTASNTANAGGTAPELRMGWSPSFTGVSLIRSNAIPLVNNTASTFSFNFFLDYYAAPSGTVTVGITYDGGTTEEVLYQVVDSPGNVGPALIEGSFTTPATGSENAQLQITYNGYTFNIDYIYWDNLCVKQVIPVELTSFTAKSDNNTVTLNWTTATELNNSGFQIERSNGGEYQSVGFVAGHGTSTSTNNYVYLDQNVEAGTYTYRLKQIDLDGSFEYSNAVEVEVLGLREYTLGQNYPNPFNPSTTINFSLAVDSKVSLKVFNVLGQEVASLLNGQMSAGSQKVSFDASSLNSGVYFYRLEADGIDGQKFSSTKKMILTK
ncbi:MAG TPA: T9SS type A sorting domain-containing protein [Ignavibacteriaceae bacterium]|nr:T9SS type A sorting domain-containing protein [Ignavibacteriaceae bacterium]